MEQKDKDHLAAPCGGSVPAGAVASRYPCDYLRMKVGDDYGKGLISRAAASKVRTAIAEVLGLDDRGVAIALADAFLREQKGT